MKRTATRQEVFDRARKLGVTIEEAPHEITATAPEGHLLSLTYTHSALVIWDPLCDETKAGAWARILHDLSDGVRPCLAAGDCYCRK